ncbi:hypothetical protein ACFV2D_04975 [Streptomyces capillispiralis]|uniref:hypothetical protein n=1 Tax=Streptomyces capillispiralis TaxID=68182 RepID=UPI003687C54B
MRDASRAGEPAAVRRDDVDRLVYERRLEASLRQRDAVEFARQVRRTLWPDEELDRVVLADGREDIANPDQARRVVSAPRGRDALRTLNPDAVALFGRAAVETAAMDRDAWTGNCRWCFADASARALGGLAPADSPAYRALLGSDPCPRDRARWQQETTARRKARARLEAAIEDRRRAEAQARARQEFRAARDGLSAASQRHATAVRSLASVDPSAAPVTAAGAPQGRGPGNLPCGCTYATYCPTHAAMFGTSDRSVSRR